MKDTSSGCRYRQKPPNSCEHHFIDRHAAVTQVTPDSDIQSARWVNVTGTDKSFRRFSWVFTITDDNNSKAAYHSLYLSCPVLNFLVNFNFFMHGMKCAAQKCQRTEKKSSNVKFSWPNECMKMCISLNACSSVVFKSHILYIWFWFSSTVDFACTHAHTAPSTDGLQQIASFGSNIHKNAK